MISSNFASVHHECQENFKNNNKNNKSVKRGNKPEEEDEKIK